MPSNAALKTMNAVHRAMMKLTRGGRGWTVANMPVIELTTTGRTSGQQRSVMLTTPWRDGDRMAIIASAGGNDQHPAWFLNLRDNPLVNVRTQSGSRPMTARITEGEERSTMWESVTSKYDNYAEYQTKTNRQIPVVILEPAAET